MRNVCSKTPSCKQQQRDETSAEKTSGRKLVQARLPFKIIGCASTTPSTVVSASNNDKPMESATLNSRTVADDCEEGGAVQEARKRRLSYDVCENSMLVSAESKETLTSASAKKISAVTLEDVVMLSDSDGDEAVIDTAAKVNTSMAIKTACASASPKTPLQGNKRKGAGTPMIVNNSGGNGRKDTSRGNTPKLQIKLPLSKKKKHRKSLLRTPVSGGTESSNDTTEDSSDDIEIIAEEMNPQKRQRIDPKGQNIVELDDQQSVGTVSQGSKSDNDTDTKKVLADTPSTPSTTSSLTMESKHLESKCDDRDKQNQSLDEIKDIQKDLETAILISNSDDENVTDPKSQTLAKKSEVPISEVEQKSKKRDSEESEENISNSTIPKSVSITNVKETDEVSEDYEDAYSSSSSLVELVDTVDEKPTGDKSENIQTKVTKKTSDSINRTKQDDKNLTPKQKRLMEQRRLAREAKERKLHEERLQKQREKEERELMKKRDRDEKLEQKRKEREEKEEQKRKDREEKERKRLAEVEAKNEERRKRNEIKEEELRKKEEERKRKEQEKEEAENKKKKAAEAFSKYFVSKTTRRSSLPGDEPQQNGTSRSDGEGDAKEIASLAFRPFQIKGDMKLAPICRKVFTNDAREKLDSFVATENLVSLESRLPTSTELYLSELKTGRITPHKWKRPLCGNKEEDDDVVVVEDELERAAQEIIDESSRPLERYRAKFYKFYENRRPPYFGTWRKKTEVITPRRPFAVDKKFFDYEVDSDLEWEEEEPGESLDGSDEEKEKESEDDDYEVDNEWFVPHGHLSEEELQNEDECGLGDGNTREAQKAKLKLLQQEFAQEMKKKTEKIKPRLVGCIWQDHNGNQPEHCPNIIWESLNARAMLYTSAPLVEEPIAEAGTETSEPNSPSSGNATAATTEKLKPILLSEKMLKDLVRLVHGNRHSKAFLINEFIAYIEQTEDGIKSGDVRGPLKSTVRDKIDEFALWQVLESKTTKSKSKKIKKKLCWLVSQDKLKEYDLENLSLHNKWSYTLQPKFVESNLQNGNPSVIVEEESTESVGMIKSDTSSPSASHKKLASSSTDVMTKFTKALTTDATTKTEESSAKIDSISRPAQNPKPATKKRVPLLMSVARGQHIPTTAKNALISQFLKKSRDTSEKAVPSTSAHASESAMDVDGVVVLD